MAVSMRDAAPLFTLALVLLFRLTRCLLGYPKDRSETSGDAEAEAKPGQPTVRSKLLVEPLSA